ncbi:conserved hypothetical protein [Gammaproteobacteria bacterium]
MRELVKSKLEDSWRECVKHIYHLSCALADLQKIGTLTKERYAILSDEEIRTLDQFVFRFSKLQDAVGVRLFSSILEYLEEPYVGRPMIDKLNRLEKLGFIESVEQWHILREIRNRFSHVYPDNAEKNAALLRLAMASVQDLKNLLQIIFLRMTERDPTLQLVILPNQN